MIQTAIGISDDIDIGVALEEVFEQCRKQLGSCLPQAGVFFTSCMDADFSEILGRIQREFPGLQLVGCTTDGEISRETGCIEDSLALLLLASDTLEFAVAVATNLSENAHDSYLTAFREACEKLDRKPACAFTFPDGLTTMGIGIDKAIRHAFGESFPVFGGTAGDHYLFTGCYQFCNNQVYSNAAPILIIAGDIELTSAVRTGPLPTGLHFKVDKHKDNVVYQIDGKTTVDFLREHLGEFRDEFSEFPLAVYENNSTDYYLRDPVYLNKEDGSISFVGTFPEQCTVRLALVSRADVLDAAQQANTCILNTDKGTPPEIIFVFPCTWIRHILGSRTNDTFSALHQAPGRIPFFGFYCYGEIAPFEIGKPSRFHNDTYVIIGLRSKNP